MKQHERDIRTFCGLSPYPLREMATKAVAVVLAVLAAAVLFGCETVEEDGPFDAPTSSK